jgi:hypothetical protein
MRPLFCSTQIVLALGMTLHGCSQSPAPGTPSGTTLAQEGLQVGQLAPEIEGEDLDGVPFKLSDYRGKVVVLDFWGTW